MKQYTRLLALLILGASIAACNKDDDGGGPDNTPTSAMATTYKDTLGNETNWSATSASASQTISGMAITGMNTNNASFILTVNDWTEGTYSGSAASITFTKGSLMNPDIYSSSGSTNTFASITVTEVDTLNKTISGTFLYNLANVNNASDFIFNETQSPGTFTDVPYTDDTGGGFGSGTLSVTLDGTPLTDNNALGIAFFGTLSISGTFNNNSMAIVLPDDIDAGTYSITDLSGTGAITYTAADSYFATSGTVVITSHNMNAQNIVGTFECVLTSTGGGTISATNGSFDIDY